MKVLLTLLLLQSVLVARPQSCSCLEEFRFVKAYMEKNHGGFNKKIRTAAAPAYAAFVSSLETAIRKEKDNRYCIGYLKKYILYLQDHHSTITAGASTVVNENDPAAVAAFLQSPANRQTEIISLDTASLLEGWRKTPPAGIEGVYCTADSTYTVALVRHVTDRHDYAAVILQTRTKLWQPGQVKFELKRMDDSLYECYTAYRNHSINYEEIRVQGGKAALNGWIKLNPGAPVTTGATDRQAFSFRVLDSTSTLLSIRSFNAGLTRTLDSFYATVIPVIRQYPRLIVDVRDNSGGSDLSYKALMPLLYTGPFESDVMEYYVTPDNMKAYAAYDSALLRKDPKSSPPFQAPLALMKKSKPFRFTRFGNGKPATVRYPVEKGNPVKVAVVYNRGCASSCESFLFELLHSSKTIRVGENSGGYTGYGNVMTIPTPCGNTLAWTTTVYRKQWEYEFVGIPPQYQVPAVQTDWIGYALRLLNQ